MAYDVRDGFNVATSRSFVRGIHIDYVSIHVLTFVGNSVWNSGAVINHPDIVR